MATLIGNQRGLPAWSASRCQASATMPLPSTQKPMAVFSARRVRLPQPKASLDPSANPMVDAIPTAARNEPLRPCTNAGRFDTILGAVISPMEKSAKQSAPTGDMRPGLDNLTVI